MVKHFEKPSGYKVTYDSKVHSKEYLAMLKSKFKEIKPKTASKPKD